MAHTQQGVGSVSERDTLRKHTTRTSQMLSVGEAARLKAACGPIPSVLPAGKGQLQDREQIGVLSKGSSRDLRVGSHYPCLIATEIT